MNGIGNGDGHGGFVGGSAFDGPMRVDSPVVQQCAQTLQAAAGVLLVNGSLTLHFNDGRVQSLQATTYLRVTGEKVVDRTGK